MSRRKRSIKDPLYKTKLCNKWIRTGECPYTYKCQFAHGESELRKPEKPDNPEKPEKPGRRRRKKQEKPVEKKISCPPPGFENLPERKERTSSDLSVKAKEWIPSTYICTRTLKYQNNTQDDVDYEQYWGLIQSIVLSEQYAK